jgi:hypothetical protein
MLLDKRKNEQLRTDLLRSVQIRRISVIRGLWGTGKRILSKSQTITDDTDSLDSHRCF